MAQIKVNSDLVNPEAIHIYSSSTQMWLENKVGYVRVKGEWIPFIEYQLTVYSEGLSFYTFRLSRTTDMTNHYKIGPSGATNLTFASLTTNEFINVTSFNKIYFEISKNSSSLGTNYLGLYDPSKSTSSATGGFIAYSTKNHNAIDNTDRLIIELDITAVVGDYQIRCVHTNTMSSSSFLNIHKIWLE